MSLHPKEEGKMDIKEEDSANAQDYTIAVIRLHGMTYPQSRPGRHGDNHVRGAAVWPVLFSPPRFSVRTPSMPRVRQEAEKNYATKRHGGRAVFPASLRL